MSISRHELGVLLRPILNQLTRSMRDQSRVSNGNPCSPLVVTKMQLDMLSQIQSREIGHFVEYLLFDLVDELVMVAEHHKIYIDPSLREMREHLASYISLKEYIDNFQPDDNVQKDIPFGNEVSLLHSKLTLVKPEQDGEQDGEQSQAVVEPTSRSQDAGTDITGDGARVAELAAKLSSKSGVAPTAPQVDTGWMDAGSGASKPSDGGPDPS